MTCAHSYSHPAHRMTERNKNKREKNDKWIIWEERKDKKINKSVIWMLKVSGSIQIIKTVLTIYPGLYFIFQENIFISIKNQ